MRIPRRANESIATIMIASHDAKMLMRDIADNSQKEPAHFLVVLHTIGMRMSVRNDRVGSASNSVQRLPVFGLKHACHFIAGQIAFLEPLAQARMLLQHCRPLTRSGFKIQREDHSSGSVRD
jgi:hypothetical protein